MALKEGGLRIENSNKAAFFGAGMVVG